MSQEEGPNGATELVGLPIEEAVEVVLAGDDSRDPETVRAALESVSAGGVVSQGAVRAAMAEASTVVSAPETRVESVAIELADARAIAEEEGVIGLDTVRSRLDAAEEHLDAVEERIEALGPRLREIIDRRGDPGGAYEVATGLRDLGAEANELQLVAEELQRDLEMLGQWLTTPEARYDEFEEEVETVESSLDDLAGTVDALAAVDDADAADDADAPSDPGATWAESTIQTRVLGLLVADLRAELADLRDWPAPEGTDPERTGALADRLDGLEERCGTLAERLADRSRPAWSDRFEEHVEGVEDALAAFEPPVPWGEVEGALERHRAAPE